MKPYLTHEHPIRFAHRGSRTMWPENTMMAFQGAVDLGYRYLETDLHVSRDQRVVLFHDDSLERLTNGKGRFWDHDWETLRALDAAHQFDKSGGYPQRGQGVVMPLLEDALRAFPDALFNLDLKQPRIEAVVADEIARLGAEDRVLIGSFYDARIRRFREITEGRIATSAGPREISRAVSASYARRAAAGPSDVLQVPERLATKRLVEAAHRADRQVHVWTVNDPGAMRRLLDIGADGIMTDRPDLLNEVMGR